MPGVLSKPMDARKPTELPSDAILDIYMLLPRVQSTKAACAGRRFAGPLLARGARLPKHGISIGCQHPESGVMIHDDYFFTVIATADFKDRLQSLKDHVVIDRFYIDSPRAAHGDVAIPFLPKHFDTIKTQVLWHLRDLLADADVEVAQTPTNQRQLSSFMCCFASAKAFHHVSDIQTGGFVDLSLWYDAYLAYGRNVYRLEVRSMDVSLPLLESIVDFPAKAMMRIVVHLPDVQLGMKIANMTSHLQHRWFGLPLTHPGFQIVVLQSMDNWLGTDSWLLDDVIECDIVVRRSKLKISLVCQWDRCIYTVENICGKALKYP